MQIEHNLFAMQTELIDKKVEVAVNNAIMDVKNMITSLHAEVVGVREEARNFKAEVSQEFTAVREELRNFKSEVAQEFGAVREELRDFKFEVSQEFAAVRKEFSTELGSLREEVRNNKHELSQEISGLRHEMQQGFSAFDPRIVALETVFVQQRDRKLEIRSRFLDYAFKTGWMVSVTSISVIFSLTAVFLRDWIK